MSMAPIPPAAKPALPLEQNRRRGNRHRLHIHATLILDGYTPTSLEVTVTEMSVGGVGFRVKQSLNLQAEGQLTSFDTLIPPGMRVHIISQRQLPSGEFEVGAKVL
jgi:hypothetical protein